MSRNFIPGLLALVVVVTPGYTQLAREAGGDKKTFGPFYDPGPGKWKNLGTSHAGGAYTVNLGITQVVAELSAADGKDVTISGSLSVELGWPDLFKVSSEFKGEETVSTRREYKVSVPIPPCGWGETQIRKRGRSQRCYFQVYTMFSIKEPSRTRTEWDYVTVVSSGKLEDQSKCVEPSEADLNGRDGFRSEAVVP